MKKLFAILAIASVMTACNGSGEEKAATTDSPKTENPVTEAVNVADSANKVMTNVADSANKVINKVADSAGKVVEKVKEAVKH
jgi:ElaB/YqjD/DUF883 family membrane-anchored ribosome-binding protein